MSMTAIPQASLYSVSFESRLFGGRCIVEVTVDLNTGQASSVLSMPSLLSAQPVFAISLEDLKAFAEGVQQLKARSRVLASLPNGAQDAWLKCLVGNATAVVFQPEGKPDQFTMNIGAYHRHGDLGTLDLAEIHTAIEKLTSFEKAALARVGSSLG